MFERADETIRSRVASQPGPPPALSHSTAVRLTKNNPVAGEGDPAAWHMGDSVKEALMENSSGDNSVMLLCGWDNSNTRRGDATMITFDLEVDEKACQSIVRADGCLLQGSIRECRVTSVPVGGACTSR